MFLLWTTNSVRLVIHTAKQLLSLRLLSVAEVGRSDPARVCKQTGSSWGVTLTWHQRGVQILLSSSYLSYHQSPCLMWCHTTIC